MSATAAEIERLRGEIEGAATEQRQRQEVARLAEVRAHKLVPGFQEAGVSTARTLLENLDQLEAHEPEARTEFKADRQRAVAVISASSRPAGPAPSAAPLGEDSPFDPETGQPRDPLTLLNRLSGPVEFLGVKQIGKRNARSYFTVKHSATGEPVELDPLTTTQLRTGSLAKLADAVWEARGGNLPTPRKNSERWCAFMDAVAAASVVEDHGASDEGAWRRRLAAYLDRSEMGVIDLNDPEKKRHVVAIPWPFTDAEGRVWVSLPHWLEQLETRRIDADDAAVRSALKHLGFEPEQLTARVDGEPRSRRYWRSPAAFDWRAEA